MRARSDGPTNWKKIPTTTSDSALGQSHAMMSACRGAQGDAALARQRLRLRQCRRREIDRQDIEPLLREPDAVAAFAVGNGEGLAGLRQRRPPAISGTHWARYRKHIPAWRSALPSARIRRVISCDLNAPSFGDHVAITCYRRRCLSLTGQSSIPSRCLLDRPVKLGDDSEGGSLLRRLDDRIVAADVEASR